MRSQILNSEKLPKGGSLGVFIALGLATKVKMVIFSFEHQITIIPLQYPSSSPIVNFGPT